MKLKIAPSILSADFGKLNDEIATVDRYVELMHIDIMDGHFVPNITFGSSTVEKIKSRVPLDCHLMIEHPEKYIEVFAKAIKTSREVSREDDTSACYIDIHFESKGFQPALLSQIKKLGLKAALAIKPATPLDAFQHLLKEVDMILLMTVNPGFGGQSFIRDVLQKIQKVREMYPNLDIQVDGGIHEKTAQEAIKAGANVLVAGSYIFGAADRKKAIESLQPGVLFRAGGSSSDLE